jgi:prophage tail gpP-like protein
MADDPPDEIAVTGKKKQGGNEVKITANGMSISGWTGIRITRGIELCPSSFDLSLTEKFPGASDVIVTPGTPCTVSIGDSLTITGYVDRFGIGIAGQDHSLSIQGRGKCSDLVDCSAKWQGNQISGSSIVGIAQKLAEPYGIDVELVSGTEPSDPIPQFNFFIGETPWEVIEKIARHRQLLAYEDEHGTLLFDTVGSTAAKAGFTEGVNVETASVIFSMDERFSEYDVYTINTDILADAPGNSDNGNLQAQIKDQFVPRYRNKAFICETGASGQQLSLARAKWEMGRRFGRSYAVRITTDTWRDSPTTLWEPNTTVLLNLPSLKLVNQTWVISQVTYRRDGSGTHADLVIMPGSAFQPEPVLLQPNFAPEIGP